MMQAVSDREFILQRVVRILAESADASNDSNLVLQLALTELVKQVMRELAQDTEADYLQGNLLSKALQTTTQLIQERVETADLPFDLSPYLERIYRSQRWVAREMTELGLRLRQAQHGEVLRSPRVVLDAPVSFRVTELGTRGTPKGLIAYPLTACRLNRVGDIFPAALRRSSRACNPNLGFGIKSASIPRPLAAGFLILDEIRQEYRVRGLGYPWEVEVEEITFVVEADGSIITFLEGFPDSVIEQARSALNQLAQDLYEPIEGG